MIGAPPEHRYTNLQLLGSARALESTHRQGWLWVKQKRKRAPVPLLREGRSQDHLPTRCCGVREPARRDLLPTGYSQEPHASHCVELLAAWAPWRGVAMGWQAHGDKEEEDEEAEAASSATSGTTRRLAPIAEEEEKAEEEQVVGKGEVAGVEAKVSSVAAAAPLECNEGGFSGAAPAVDWGAYRPASQHYNGYFRAAPPAAAHYSVAYSTAAAAATAPATAHAPAAEAGEERVEKEHGLEVVKEVEEEEKMPEEEQVAEEEQNQAAGKAESGKEDGEEAVEMEVAAPSLAAAAARSSTSRGLGGAALATVWGACRTASRNFFGSFRTAPPAAAQNDSVAYSTAAVAATAPAAAAAAVETPSACVDRGHERGEEGEADRREKGEGHMGESAGETALANLGKGGEYGSPVPAKFRPEDSKDDALCSWKRDFFDSVPDETELGAGSFGIVVTATLKMGEEMAMKVMARTNPAEERATKNEVDILEQCSAHPNVIDYYGFIRTPTSLCILMPKAFCDLAHMIEESTLTEKHAVGIARQIVSAVEFLHGRGIVHRDIKPGNILIGEKSVVLLADFGLAIATNGNPISGESACGTLPYMAPELLKGLPYGSAVDMWATGVVTYEVLHGVRPFTGGGGNSGGSGGGGNHSGSVSNTSGSIVTAYRNRSGSMETPGGTNREEVLQRKILLGEYAMDTSRVGGNGRDFIAQLLSRNPHDRATAAQAAEHGWVHASSNASRRKRMARLTVALVTMERAMSAAQRLQARVQPLSDLGRAAANTRSTALAEATAAAASAVSGLDRLVVTLSDIKTMGENAKTSEKAGISARVTNGGDEDAAEEVVRTVEMFVREAEKPVAEATATVDSWEKAVRQAALP